MAATNAITSPGYLMPRGVRVSEFGGAQKKLRGEQQGTTRRPSFGGALCAAAGRLVSPKHVRPTIAVVPVPTDALTGIPPSAQERRT